MTLIGEFMSTYTSAISNPSGRNFIAYIFRDADSFIYKVTDNSFVGDVLADLNGNARVPYRLSYTEKAPGSYTLDIDLTNFQDGDYTLEARELANNVEYDNVLTDLFRVENGAVTSTDIIIKITTAPTRSLFAYIRSTGTDQYFRLDTLSLDTLDLVSDSIDRRSKFRNSYAEHEPSNYTLIIDASTLPNGVYVVSTYELVGDVEIEAGQDYTFRVQDGKQLSGVDFGSINMSENSGGKDNLRYVEGNGNGVEGAVVSVYLSSEYEQGNTANPIGKTTTDHTGRWTTPISVDPGANYTVVFYKRGHFGPDSSEEIL